ncbi:homoserine dehydrogenase [Candidatus Sumerlaeota bacterium]|nr:homoserine dehydrogenase [Candidatus Sumerlaeota bacterium]
MKKGINIGIIGFGNIGTAVVHYLRENTTLINTRAGTEIQIAKIADIDLERPRDVKVEPSLLTTDAESLINDPSIHIIIELIGGIEPARTYIESAIRNKKSVVTANKALMAECGAELLALARSNNVQLRFEASVGAGIPIIRSIQQALAANYITAIYGILNGTSNYILTAMAQEKKEFSEALADAQARGYAEPDPSFDVEGIDTAHKIAILGSLAFKQDIKFSDVHIEGITQIEHTDILYAAELGYTIKLLGLARIDDQQNVEVFTHPSLVPQDSLLAAVNGVYNGVMIEGTPVGRQLYYGEGAGKGSTASAILSDVISIARWMTTPSVATEKGVHISEEELPSIPVGYKKVKPIDELEVPYYFRFSVIDRPGTMARLSKILGDNDISIASMIQKTINPMNYATLIIVTHRANESAVRKAVNEITALDICEKPPLILRVLELT